MYNHSHKEELKILKKKFGARVAEDIMEQFCGGGRFTLPGLGKNACLVEDIVKFVRPLPNTDTIAKLQGFVAGEFAAERGIRKEQRSERKDLRKTQRQTMKENRKTMSAEEKRQARKENAAGRKQQRKDQRAERKAARKNRWKVSSPLA